MPMDLVVLHRSRLHPSVVTERTVKVDDVMEALAEALAANASLLSCIGRGSWTIYCDFDP